MKFAGCRSCWRGRDTKAARRRTRTRTRRARERETWLLREVPSVELRVCVRACVFACVCVRPESRRRVDGEGKIKASQREASSCRQTAVFQNGVSRAAANQSAAEWLSAHSSEGWTRAHARAQDLVFLMIHRGSSSATDFFFFLVVNLLCFCPLVVLCEGMLFF